MNIRIILIFLLMNMAACGGGSGGAGGGSASAAYQYQVPSDRADGWTVGSVDQVGISQSLMEQATNDIRDGVYTGIDGMVVIRNGLLVHEAYFNGFSFDSRHDLRSATKSITSALIGIAIDQQIIASVDESALSYIDSYANFLNWDDRKDDIEIEHLLTMTPGLNCDDVDPQSPGNERYMYPKNDWVKFIFDLPMLNDPGQVYGYCTGGVVALGAVLDGAAGIRSDSFANQFLFAPLDIRNFNWKFTPSLRVDTGGHIHMTPRDMAKIGELYLRRGYWNGAQIISEQWVDTSTANYLTIDALHDYGYLWWRRHVGPSRDHLAIYASGNGGQYIFILPGDDIVVVFTGGNYNSNLSGQPLEIMDRYIIPAL